MTTKTTKQTRAEAVYDALRGEVLTARVPPATKLKLADYSERFDVSLSVVREALSRLAEQGLIQANPQRGFSTLPLSVDDLTDLTRARMVIETGALRESIAHGDLAWESEVVAAQHRLAATPLFDDDGSANLDFGVVHRAFHIALLAGSGSAHLESIATGLRDRAELYLYWSRHLSDDTGRDIGCEHRRIAELTIARDADQATEALAQHIQRTTDGLVRYIRTHGALAPTTTT